MLALSVVVWLCAASLHFAQGGELTVKIVEGCSASQLDDGLHYVSMHSRKLDTISTNHIRTTTIDEIKIQHSKMIQSLIASQSQSQSQSSQLETETQTESDETIVYGAELVNLINVNNVNNDNNNNNVNNINSYNQQPSTVVYLLYIDCVKGDMYLQAKDYYILFDEFNTPMEGFDVSEIGNELELFEPNEDSDSGSIADESGSAPLDTSSAKNTLKWTGEYIVWVILLVMVGVFGLGIFLLLYWWCCHGRTYRLVETSSFPQTAYTQLRPEALNSNIYGSAHHSATSLVVVPGAPGNGNNNDNGSVSDSNSVITTINMEGGNVDINDARHIYQTPNGSGNATPTQQQPIDDTMVSQTITVERDVLP